MNVGTICHRRVVTIQKDASIRQAARLMRSEHVGDLIVVQENDRGLEPVGILTDRDVVIEVLAEDVDANEVCVGDVMSGNLLTASEDDSVWETIRQMSDRGVRRLPVLDDVGKLQGILSVDDLIPFLAEQLTDLSLLFAREQEQEREIRNTA